MQIVTRTMGCSVTIYVSKPIIDRAAPLLDSGEFETFSEVCRYSIHYFLDWLEEDEVTTLIHIRRTQPVKRNVQLNEVVLERILEYGLVTRAEIADYALVHYLEHKGL